jgi:fyn-related kinase
MFSNLRKGSGPQQQQPTSKNAYVALFDYDSRTDQDLSFKKGEVLYIFDEDKKANGWWLAKLRDSQLQGYIPSQYVAQLDSLESQPWYFGQIKRMEAEKLLMLESNRNGSFLIRISDGNNHAYSLSVRDGDSVKHYRIHMAEGKCYITKKAPFGLLNDLVVYYTKRADGLCVQLTVPCVKVDKPITKGLTHSFMKDHEMDRNQFRLEKKIGQGQFGDVWQAEFIENRMKVAIKTLKEGMNSTDFRAEAELMRNLYHSKLIQLYALCTKEEPIYIVTELMVNGSLLDYLQTPVGKRLQLDTLIYIASQIADGMAYLESHSYIHRDLAARNVLVGENNEVKVADFGLARVIKDVSTSNIYSAREGTKFPIKWTAPEAAIFNKFSIKSDVWSFGIVLTEIITHGRTPYPSMSNQEVLQQVSRGYRMQQPANCGDKLYSIMMSCWKNSAEDRPTFEALKYKLENYFDEDDNRQYRDTNNPSSNSNGMR